MDVSNDRLSPVPRDIATSPVAHSIPIASARVSPRPFPRKTRFENNRVNRGHGVLKVTILCTLPHTHTNPVLQTAIRRLAATFIVQVALRHLTVDWTGIDQSSKPDPTRPGLSVIDGPPRGGLFNRLIDDTDDTKSTMPDINTILVRDRLASAEGCPVRARLTAGRTLRPAMSKTAGFAATGGVRRDRAAGRNHRH